MERMLLPADRKKETIIKAEEEITFDYGSIPELREPLSNYMNFGIINLDKPSGPTSHEITVWVKRILNLEKTGHAGTLDPKVTGILPVALGDAPKILQGLISAGKEYTCILKLHKEMHIDRVVSAMNLFTTDLWQRPPLKSAVARVMRKRRIYYMDFIEKKENLYLFRVGCQAGTYIRKLCHDFGEVLFCGGNMEELRRTRAGLFTEETNMVTLQDLNDAVYLYREENDPRYLRHIIQPMEKAVKHMDKIIIRDTAVDAICHGADLAINGVLNLHATIQKGDLVAVMTQKGEMVAFSMALQSARKIATLNSGLIAKTKRVIMPRKTYQYFKKKKK